MQFRENSIPATFPCLRATRQASVPTPTTSTPPVFSLLTRHNRRTTRANKAKIRAPYQNLLSAPIGTLGALCALSPPQLHSWHAESVTAGQAQTLASPILLPQPSNSTERLRPEQAADPASRSLFKRADRSLRRACSRPRYSVWYRNVLYVREVPIVPYTCTVHSTHLTSQGSRNNGKGIGSPALFATLFRSQ